MRIPGEDVFRAQLQMHQGAQYSLIQRGSGSWHGVRTGSIFVKPREGRLRKRWAWFLCPSAFSCPVVKSFDSYLQSNLTWTSRFISDFNWRPLWVRVSWLGSKSFLPMRWKWSLAELHYLIDFLELCLLLRPPQIHPIITYWHLLYTRHRECSSEQNR